MNRLIVVFLFFSLPAFGAVSLSPGSGVPGVTTVPVGSDLAVLLSNAPNTGASYQLGAGTYPVQPGIVGLGGVNYAHQTRAINLFSKTNITIIGVPGHTIIDGSDYAVESNYTNRLGEILYITNCMNVLIEGVTIKGQAITNYTLLGTWDVAGFALVSIYNCKNVTLRNCTVKDSFNAGIWDLAAGSTFGPHSTNIVIQGGLVRNTGSFRTNSILPYDGTAIDPTGWLIDGVTLEENLRHVEPYDEIDGYIFRTCIIRNCIMRNCIESAITTGGSTNHSGVLIKNNYIYNDPDYTRRGTNVLPGSKGVDWNSGQAPRIIGNTIRAMKSGIYIAPTKQMYDVQIVDNFIDTIGSASTGDGIGIFLGDASFNVSMIRNSYVSGNIISKCEINAIQLAGVSDTIFANNRLIDPVDTGGLDAVRIYDGTSGCNSNLLFIGNTILDPSPVDADSGFKIETANPIALRFIDNLIQGPSVLYNNSAPLNQISIVGPPQTYTFTNDFPSLGAGANFITNFPATGVRTNDLIALMAPSQARTAGNSTNITLSFWPSNDSIFLQLQAIQAADPQSIRTKFTARQVEPY